MRRLPLFASLALLLLACSDGGSRPTKPNAAMVCDGAALDAGEVCDGAFLAGESCESLGFSGGTLRCNVLCTDYDTSACSECGNGQVEGAEACDGDDLGDASCQSLGFGGGILACDVGCLVLDTSGCQAEPGCSGPNAYREGGLNTGLADGEPCNYAADCANGCNSSFYCGAEGTAPVAHAGDLPLGAACDADASCASGYCWTAHASWICAEPCETPIAASAPGLACQAIEAPTPAPESGAACIPGPGAAGIGEACDIGEFDCQSGTCLNEEFCTQACDPTDATGCPAGSACELYGAGIYGDIYVCVDDTRIAAGDGASPGDPCSGAFDCPASMACFEGACTVLCPNGDECPSGSYCAADHPAGALCLPDGSRGNIGDPCQLDSECPPQAVCYDNGPGPTCHATCPSGTCADTSLACLPSATGPELDTVVSLFTSVDGATAAAANDDTGLSYFSELLYDVPSGSQELWLEVTRYPSSPTGPYRLEIFSADAPLDGTVTAEAADNDTRATAQSLGVPATVSATFVDASGSADVDAFRISVTGPVLLTVRTDLAQSNICRGTPALLADGEACSADVQCQNRCFPFDRDGGASFCAKPCSTNGDCGGGVCQPFADGNSAARFCFPAGGVGLGSAAFGAACEGPHDCASRMCLQHPYDTSWVCGAPCGSAAAGQACESSGVCSSTNPIYRDACVPHLGGTVPPGGSCRFSADCQAGYACAADRCVSEGGATRYDPPSLVGDGGPCNLDTDCAGGSCFGFVCRPPTAVSCSTPNGVVDAGEICDPGAQPTVTCADLGAGLASQSPSCLPGCDGWELTTCTGLPSGSPCNVDSDCAAGNCVDGGNTWFCADWCAGASDTTCAGTLFGEAVSCRSPDGGFSYACLPAPGSGAPADPCRSGYLDCQSGLCWDGAFCIQECSLGATDCGRNASCVSYAYDRMIDTRLSMLDAAGVEIAGPNDDVSYPDNLWSSVGYTNAGTAAELVWVRVDSSAAVTPPATGEYQLQCWSDAAPPPFGTPLLESELRANAVANDTVSTAQAIDDLLPSRVQASLGAQGDIDVYRVQLGAGDTLAARTTYPLAQICWPTGQLGLANGAECGFSFECASGACIDTGYCADECTAGGACATGTVCARPAGEERDYCFRTLAYGEDCTTAPMSPDGATTPVCPNGACFSRDGATYRCSDNCLTNAAGTGCGRFDAAMSNFDGECFLDPSFGFVCLEHAGRSVGAGGACLLDADCSSGCCDWTVASPICAAPRVGACHADQ